MTTPISETENLTEYARNLEERLKIIHNVHKIKLEEEQRNMKEKYDEHIRITHKYQIGDRVYLKDPTGIVGISRKLQPEYYKDVFEVVEASGEHNVKLKNTSTGKDLTSVINVDRLKPVIGREPPREKGDGNGNPEEKENGNGKPSGELSMDNGQNPELDREKVGVADRIVEQKGSGERRRFRIQWKEKDGRTRSCWETWDNVPREIVQQWERTHGRTGKTLKTFRRTRNN